MSNRIAVLLFAVGGLALTVAVLFGPDLLPVSVETKRNEVYLN